MSAKSLDLAALIAETEAAVAEADERAKGERSKTLDLLASPDATSARQATHSGHGVARLLDHLVGDREQP